VPPASGRNLVPDLLRVLTAASTELGQAQGNAYATSVAVGNLYRSIGSLRLPNIAPVLPLLMSIKGKPMSLTSRFPFEVLFKMVGVPRRLTLVTGRQVSKTTSIFSSEIVTRSLPNPYFNSAFVQPQFDQIRRFSTTVARPMLLDSPIRSMIVGDSVVAAGNVLQRTLKNGSNIFFTFGGVDTERNRGMPLDSLIMDEAQDFSVDAAEILEACLDASDWKLIRNSGTPKTESTFLHNRWMDSSQAQWTIPCSCGYTNTCCRALDMDQMIQPKGLSCRKCGAIVNPRLGHWQHMVTGGNRLTFHHGYHIPQTIMPMHCERPYEWRMILAKKSGTSQVTYVNECLGEAVGVSQGLITEQQLQAAAVLPWNNRLEEAVPLRNKYSFRVLAVDWGGGGAGQVRYRNGRITVQNGTCSFTHVAILGFLPYSLIPHVLYAERFPIELDEVDEVGRVLRLYASFNCDLLSHDFGGSGGVRDTIILRNGFPANRLFPCLYVASRNKILVYKHESDNVDGRMYYGVDKARLLRLMCMAIRTQPTVNGGHFPRWESSRTSVSDYLALLPNRHSSESGAEVTTIIRDPTKPDDFANAHAYGCAAYWFTRQQYPDFAPELVFPQGSAMQAVLTPDYGAGLAGWDPG